MPSERAKRSASRWLTKRGGEFSDIDPLADLLDRFAAEAVREEREAKDAAYSERDRLVLALSKLFPAWLSMHPEEDEEWEDDWRHIVFVQLPTGQVSWHIHDSEVRWFAHLQLRPNVWDGHTTDEKYRRLDAIRARSAAVDLFLAEYLELCRRHGYCIASDGEEVGVWPLTDGYEDEVRRGTVSQRRRWPTENPEPS